MKNNPQKHQRTGLPNSFAPVGREHAHPLVLVVEDHDDTREMLTTLLGMIGCHVIEAENGERALLLAETTHPDLILMDMRIPLLDGLTVTRLIRADPVLSDVPIVAVTGNAAPQFEVEALKAGCNHCLSKPLDFDRLEELVNVLARSATRPMSYRSHNSMVVRSRGMIRPYDFH
jgi:two-component system cell cycle response regulator DivK